MSNRIERISSILTVTLVLLTCGMVAGFLLGRSVALNRMNVRLRELAETILSNGAASSSESRMVLSELEGLRFEPCSAAEIQYFRALVLRSQYLKNVARVKDGAVGCSASDGVLSPPYALPKADSYQRDGTNVYLNLGPFRHESLPVVSLVEGRSLVVFSPYLLDYVRPGPIHFAMNVADEQSKKLSLVMGDHPAVDGMILDREIELPYRDLLYATRCSARYFNCVTTWISTRDALYLEGRGLTRWSLWGGLIGAAFGLVFSALRQQNRGMARQLRRAVRSDALRVVYQPLVDLGSGRIVGAEALARWTDEYGLAVPPDVFIPLAHEIGIVCEITELVIRRSLREMGPVLRKDPAFRLSINATAEDLSDKGMLALLAASLSEAGLAPPSLALELTERSTADPVRVQESIKHLRELGHPIYIDDFGTGYSSLAYLRDLAVDAIKIDRGFVQAIGTEAVTLAILPQVLAMAGALKLDVIVEGVETPQQAKYFAGSGARIYAQGWLYGYPVSAEEFLALFEEDKTREFDPAAVLSR